MSYVSNSGGVTLEDMGKIYCYETATAKHNSINRVYICWNPFPY